MSAMELTWALLSGAILLIVLLMLALFWQELRVRYWQEALAAARSSNASCGVGCKSRVGANSFELGKPRP